MSLWLGNLGFSGRAEKIDYEFEDICPHGPDRRKVPVGITEHDYHGEQSVFLDSTMLKLLQYWQYFYLAVFLLLPFTAFTVCK